MGNKLQEQKEKVEIQLLKFKIGFLHLGNRLEIWTLLKKKKKNERISFDSDWIYKNLGLVSWTSEILLKFTFTFNTETQRLLLSDKIKIWHRKLKKKKAATSGFRGPWEQRDKRSRKYTSLWASPSRPWSRGRDLMRGRRFQGQMPFDLFHIWDFSRNHCTLWDGQYN